MKIILMRLRITIAMLEIRNRETLQSKVNICKSDVKIGDYADSLGALEQGTARKVAPSSRFRTTQILVSSKGQN